MSDQEQMKSDAADAFSNAVSTATAHAKSMTEDISKMFGGMRPTAMPDTEALMAAHKRNLETLTAANRVAMEGAQAIVRRNVEIMQQTMAELGETMRAMTAPDSAQDRAARQAELLRRAYERTVTNTRELADMIQHANTEAMGVLNGRVMEAMDEVRSMLAKDNAKS